ncbi:hypothetical protein JOF47_003755 [Paeniglutamicibacter kerguelensis]|uniref:IS110 family transposase n=1 Tax=Paeniglutamicibacter kerguelensis TaxID=254788 RepID=A0ABS4XIE0_9MICC|nr:hypothetical protein [Paeniglutamicibacter kerguelensis]
MIKDHETIDVFIGVDVGKSNHHAVALNRAGKSCWTRPCRRTKPSSTP